MRVGEQKERAGRDGSARKARREGVIEKVCYDWHLLTRELSNSLSSRPHPTSLNPLYCNAIVYLLFPLQHRTRRGNGQAGMRGDVDDGGRAMFRWSGISAGLRRIYALF
jgi:hypothetical protein